MISRSLLIIAPVALITACATGQPELESTSSSKQALCTTNCDDSTSSYTLKDWSGTTIGKGDYAEPTEPSPGKVGQGDSFSCDCNHVENGIPAPLQLVWDGSNWVCRKTDEKCCTPSPTSDPGFTPSSSGDSATYKQTQGTPGETWPPITEFDDGTTCGPSSYTSSYNPCTYAWNGPYYRCSWNGYCFCSST